MLTSNIKVKWQLYESNTKVQWRSSFDEAHCLLKLSFQSSGKSV